MNCITDLSIYFCKQYFFRGELYEEARVLTLISLAENYLETKIQKRIPCIASVNNEILRHKSKKTCARYISRKLMKGIQEDFSPWKKKNESILLKVICSGNAIYTEKSKDLN